MCVAMVGCHDNSIHGNWHFIGAVSLALPSLPLHLPVSFSVVETQFIDYRFMKDLELRRDPKFCCFCRGNELLIYADDKDSVRLECDYGLG